MLRVIRNILQNLINDIDAGNSNVSEEEALEIIDKIRRISDKSRLSKYSACQYLNVSRATFDNYVREGRIPKGSHSIGFKELSWSKSDLDKFIKESRNGHK